MQICYYVYNFKYTFGFVQICYYVYIILYIHLVCTNTLLKKIELQNSIWFYLPKPNNDPIHFERTYLVHFQTNLNDFCGFGCARYIIAQKKIEAQRQQNNDQRS